jgi:hypothetical protein
MSGTIFSLKRLLLPVEVFWLLSLPTACSSETGTDLACPSYDVVPDAGVSGFSSIGESKSGSVCAQYCRSGYFFCQLVSQTTVKCQPACL